METFKSLKPFWIMTNMKYIYISSSFHRFRRVLFLFKSRLLPAYEETSLLVPNLPNPVILDVASTQPHHLSAIISEPPVMFDGLQQRIIIEPSLSLAMQRYLFSFFFFPFLLYNVMHNHFVQKMGHRLVSNIFLTSF